MKIAIISFTTSGYQLSKQVATFLKSDNHQVKQYTKSKYLSNNQAQALVENLGDWTAKAFTEYQALIFIGASGIAVRAIAPFVKDKQLDPAVVVIDEQGRFVIALLSGHLGGANKLTWLISEEIAATAVITTATDIRGQFAVDIFAKNNQLDIDDIKLAKEVSAQLLHGETVGLFSELPIGGIVPPGLVEKKDPISSNEGKEELGIYIGSYPHDRIFEKTLWLRPKNLVVGIGCRKGTTSAAIRQWLKDTCAANQLSPQAISKVCSIDLKATEAGILTYCQEEELPFITYSAEQLAKVPGKYTASDFVKQITGVDNVCERSAVLGSNMGQLIQHKTEKNGITIALAIEQGRVYFE